MMFESMDNPLLCLGDVDVLVECAAGNVELLKLHHYLLFLFNQNEFFLRSPPHIFSFTIPECCLQTARTTQHAASITTFLGSVCRFAVEWFLHLTPCISSVSNTSTSSWPVWMLGVSCWRKFWHNSLLRLLLIHFLLICLSLFRSVASPTFRCQRCFVSRWLHPSLLESSTK